MNTTFYLKDFVKKLLFYDKGKQCHAFLWRCMNLGSTIPEMFNLANSSGELKIGHQIHLYI